MATHSNIPAWETPWTEGPGKLQSTGSNELDTTDHTNKTEDYSHIQQGYSHIHISPLGEPGSFRPIARKPTSMQILTCLVKPESQDTGVSQFIERGDVLAEGMQLVIRLEMT